MTVKDFRVAPAMTIGALLILICGITLLGAALWLRPIFEGERAVADGNLEHALERYAAARQRFARLPLISSLLPSAYELVMANELSLQYSLRRYDEILETAGTSPGNDAAAFWAGCALFERALIEENAEARLGWMSQARQEFRRALELAPADWNTKFNYELTGKLTSGLQKQPQTSKQDMMKLLREAPRMQREPVRRVG